MASPFQAGFLEKVVVISSSMVYECCDNFPSKVRTFLGCEMVMLRLKSAGSRPEILPSTVPGLRWFRVHWGVKPMGWRLDSSPVDVVFAEAKYLWFSKVGL